MCACVCARAHTCVRARGNLARHQSFIKYTAAMGQETKFSLPPPLPCSIPSMPAPPVPRRDRPGIEAARFHSRIRLSSLTMPRGGVSPHLHTRLHIFIRVSRSSYASPHLHTRSGIKASVKVTSLSARGFLGTCRLGEEQEEGGILRSGGLIGGSSEALPPRLQRASRSSCPLAGSDSKEGSMKKGYVKSCRHHEHTCMLWSKGERER